MNDALVNSVGVSPDIRPWWTVRRPLLTFLGVSLILLLALSLGHSYIQNWMITKLPINDATIVRLSGY